MFGLHRQVVAQLAVSVFSFDIGWVGVVVGKGAVSVLVVHHALSLLVHFVHFLLRVWLLADVLLLRNGCSVVLSEFHFVFFNVRLHLTWAASLARDVFVEFKVIRVIDWARDSCLLGIGVVNVSATCWVPRAIGRLVKHCLVNHLGVGSFVSHHHSHIVLSI